MKMKYTISIIIKEQVKNDFYKHLLKKGFKMYIIKKIKSTSYDSYIKDEAKCICSEELQNGLIYELIFKEESEKKYIERHIVPLVLDLPFDCTISKELIG